MVGSAALYQVAVALVPALLFGGAALQLRDESPSLGGNKAAGVVVSIIIIAGVLAEIVAIKGAIDPNLPSLEQRYLVLVLTLGTAGVAFWIAAPLLTEKAGEEQEEGEEAAGSPGSPGDLGAKALLAVALVAAGVYGQFAITDSLHSSAARSRYDEVAKQRIRIEHELRTAESSDSDARAHLIALARSTPAAGLMVHLVLDRFARLDGRALSPARDIDIDPERVNQQMSAPFQVLNRIDKGLRGGFERQSGLDRGERELLLLAEARVISAVRTEMIDDVNNSVAVDRFEGACESLGLEGCRPRTVKSTAIVVSPVLREEQVGGAEPAGPRRGGSGGPQASEKPSFR